MKRTRTAGTVGLLLSAILASAVIFTSTAFGDAKHITFNDPVMVGGVMLKAGTYRVEWNGTGPEVQVAFKMNGDVKATAPATLVSEKSLYDRRSIETATGSGEARVLKRIAFSKEALVFDEPGA